MENANLLLAFGLLVSLTLAAYPITVSAQKPLNGHLFVFGDSSFDAGNKQYLTTDFVAANFWPFGKSVDRPTGRWSDGRIVPDFIADFIEIPAKQVPPILQPNADISRGASFAVDGATLLGAPANTWTLSQQVFYFNQVKGNWTTEKLARYGLYLIHVGADDYLNFTKFNPTADPSAQQAFVTFAIRKLSSNLESLYRMGARKFAIQNIEPLGCLPIVKQDYNTGDECVKLLNDLASQHNAALRPMLTDLAKRLQAFQYTIFDFYGSFSRRLNDTLHYRYASTTQACCGIGSHNAYGCGLTNVHSNLCSYQRSYMFYDGRHLSEKTNEAMGHLLFSADPNVVAPMNGRELLVYPYTDNMIEY